MDDRPVPVAVLNSRIEAELIIGLLGSNGVRAVMAPDDAGGLDPQLQGIRVPPSDATAGRAAAIAAAAARGGALSR